jgi:hypothetical protein
MNSGTFGGAANGFKISSILKVKDTKSDTGKYNLLNYVVSLIEEKKPDLLTWYEEVPDLKPGTKGTLPNNNHLRPSIRQNIYHRS